MIGTSPRYITLNDLRRYISANNNGLGTDEDELLKNCIVMAENQIDDYTRRNFVAEVGTRYYSRWTGRGMIKETALYFEDGVELFALPANGTVYGGDGRLIPVGSIWLEPRNAGPPFKLIRLYSPYVWSWNTDAEIAVPGTWGFSLTAPAAIQSATLELATYIYRSKDNGPGEVAGFDQAGNQTQPRGIPENVRRRIEPYRSRSGGRL
jgi:hypothetical protein